tara:strand:- start:6790 stop:7755 length:966 start_codon:yes stop_codon:yes gene_type:complete
MARININTGTNANDGTGDDLRTAMISINANFTELYEASPFSSQITIEGNKISSNVSNANINLVPNGRGAIVMPGVTINDNNISANRTNDDLVLNASGTGNIVVGALTINGTTISSADSSAINFAESNITLGSLNITNNVITATDSSVISFGNERISDIATPTEAKDAATKEYVDGSAKTFANLEIVTDTLQHTVTNSDLNLITQGTGMIVFNAHTAVSSRQVTHVGSSGVQPLDSFTAATFRSAEYLVSATNATETRYEVAKILVTHDGTNAYINSSSVGSQTVQMATYTADISNGQVRILIVPQSSDSVTYKMFKTLIRV